MYRIIISIGLALITLSGIRAQEPLDFNEINRETYRLFLGQEWDSVIHLGKIALKHDMDFLKENMSESGLI